MLSYIKSQNLAPVSLSVDLPPKLSAAKPPATPTEPTVSAARKPTVTATATVQQSSGEFIDIELTNMRSVIASRLTLSKVRTSIQIVTGIEVNSEVYFTSTAE